MTQLRLICGVVACCLFVAVVPAMGLLPATATPAVAADAPLAEAGLDQTVQQGSTVYLDAGGSQARVGNLSSYEWHIRMPNGTSIPPECLDCERTRFTAAETGVYNVTLTVQDAAGRTATDTMYVTVIDTGPELSLSGPDDVLVGADATVEMTASAGGANLSSVTWLVDGTQHAAAFLDGRNATHQVAVPTAENGTRTVEALLVDRNGTIATASHDVTVHEESEFAVELSDVDDEYNATDSIQPTVTVTNVGPIADTQKIRFEDFDGRVVDYEWVTLDPGERVTIDRNFWTRTLSWTPGSAYAGRSGTLTVTSDTHSDTATTEILEEPPYFEVDIFAHSVTDDPDDKLDVNATVTNTGGQTGTQDIELCIYNSCSSTSAEDTQPLTLDPGESHDMTLTVSDFADESPPLDAYVASDDDEDSRYVTEASEELPYPYFNFDANYSDINTIEAGETVNIDSVIDFNSVVVWPENYEGTSTVVYDSLSDYYNMPAGGKGERDPSQTVEGLHAEGVDAGDGGFTVNSISDDEFGSFTINDPGTYYLDLQDDISGGNTAGGDPGWGDRITIEVIDGDDGNDGPGDG